MLAGLIRLSMWTAADPSDQIPLYSSYRRQSPAFIPIVFKPYKFL